MIMNEYALEKELTSVERKVLANFIEKSLEDKPFLIFHDVKVSDEYDQNIIDELHRRASKVSNVLGNPIQVEKEEGAFHRFSVESNEKYLRFTFSHVFSKK